MLEPVWAAMPGRVGEPAVVTPLVERPPSSQPPLRLAVVGDVGTGEAPARDVAESVAAAGRSDPFDALILLGDNVYPDGDPSRLDATVFDPYGPVLDAGARLIAVLGNHDVEYGDGTDQLAALGMPGRWFRTELGPATVIALDSTRPADEAQRTWLERTLPAVAGRWTIVVLHHPPYSAGFHGSDRGVREHLVPLFERHGVDVVLAGHDHDYQRSKPVAGVTYLVSGGGAKVRPTGSAAFTAMSASTLHFVELAVWNDRIEVTAVNRDGVFDHAVVPSTAPGMPRAAASTASAGRPQFPLAAGVIGAGLVVWAVSRLALRSIAPRLDARLELSLEAVSVVALLAVAAGLGLYLGPFVF